MSIRFRPKRERIKGFFGMVELTLAANSKIDKAAGRKYPAPAGAKRVRQFVI